MSEDDRRELIARQHKALYGENSSLYEGQPPRPISNEARVLAAAAAQGQGNAPLGYGGYNQPNNSAADAGATMTATSGQGSRSRSNSTDPTRIQGPPGLGNRPSSSSPNDNAGNAQSASGNGAVGTIGSRPQPGGQAKRTSPPNPSPLGQGGSQLPPTTSSERPGSMSWGAGSGPWGPNAKNSLGQASVWG